MAAYGAVDLPVFIRAGGLLESHDSDPRTRHTFTKARLWRKTMKTNKGTPTPEEPWLLHGVILHSHFEPEVPQPYRTCD
ncbi:hypothetical protein MRX96_038753 [Rhipicephalus microplus]